MGWGTTSLAWYGVGKGQSIGVSAYAESAMGIISGHLRAICSFLSSRTYFDSIGDTIGFRLATWYHLVVVLVVASVMYVNTPSPDLNRGRHTKEKFLTVYVPYSTFAFHVP